MGKKTVQEIVTERFMNLLKEDIIPWRKPWISIKGERVGGWSHSTGRSYSLLNQMLLPDEGEYITYKQIVEEGGQLKESTDEHKVIGYPIFFYKQLEVEVEDSDEPKKIPMLRYYTVYSLKDVEGIEPKYKPDHSDIAGLKEPAKCRKAEAIIKGYTNKYHIPIKHVAQNQAYYSPSDDSVTLPLKKQFKDKAGYYDTTFHELTHSTGHKSRLNRLESTRFGSPNYAREELVAEIGASTILYNLGLETKASVDNNKAYIQSWLKRLKDDPRLISIAAGRAEKAIKMIYGEEVRPFGETV